MNLKASVALIITLSLAVATTASALSSSEKLVFNLTWTGVSAGTAIQEISEESGKLRIISTARSADWISAFFPVEDKIETLLLRESSGAFPVPQTFRMKVREGNHLRDREILFDQVHAKATYIDHLTGEKTVVGIGRNTYDPYSSFYYIRNLPLEVGKSVYVSILDNKELWNVEVQVLKKERLKTILGEVTTILVKPLVKSEGIFQKKGEIYIWLTDDSRRVPVKMKTKVTIGSITATLVESSY